MEALTTIDSAQMQNIIKKHNCVAKERNKRCLLYRTPAKIKKNTTET